MVPRSIGTAVRLLQDTAASYINDNGSRLAAALAYYAVFALPSLLVIVVTLFGLFVAPSMVEGEIAGQINVIVGREAAQQIRTILREVEVLDTKSFTAIVVGGMALFFSSMWAFLELRSALNTIWNLQSDPTKTSTYDWLVFLGRRALSFLVLVAVALVVLLSFVTSAVLSAFGERLIGILPFGLSAVALHGLEAAFSLAVVSILCAAVFKVVPDVRLQWRDVWTGAFFTAVLFQVGKLLIGIYMSNVDIGTAFGAAGSLIVLLAWIYYSTIILYLGAEFTHVWTIYHDRPLEPRPGAIRIQQS